MKRVLCFAIALVLASAARSGFAEPPGPWRVYGAADGLPETSCRFVSLGGAGNVFVQGLNSRIAACFDGYDWTNAAAAPPSDAFGGFFESPAGQLWIASTRGLCEWSEGKWTHHPIAEIAAFHRSAPDALIPICPVRQNVAIFLLPDALMELAAEKPGPPSTRTLRSARQTSIGPFTGLRVAADDGLWISGARGLLKIAGPKRAITEHTPVSEFVCPASLGARNLRRPQSADDDSVICVADAVNNSNKCIVRFDGRNWTAFSAGAAPIRFAWLGPDGVIWAATADTVYSVRDGKLAPCDDLPPGAVYDAVAGARGMFWLATSEGLFCRVPQLWQTATNPPAGLFASKAATLAAQNGDQWSATSAGIEWRHDQQLTVFSPSDPANPRGALAFVEMADGKIWSATPEKVWSFDGHNWAVLRAGLGRINAMIRASDGSVWVASNAGMHRWAHGLWTDFAAEEGLQNPAARDVGEDALGRIWAETPRGFAVYQPDADPDPPRTFIASLPVSERRVPPGGSINIAFSARDKWNLTPPGRLLFSWRLDDRDWSAFDSAASVPFLDLPPGQHYFQVRSMDRNGNIDLHPARLEFAVVLPWYRESRSIWIAAIGAAAALFFAGLALKRHLDLLRSYAEVGRQVAERTAELKRASEELLQSQKMTAIGALAAGIAHDFNNILSIIKGSAQIIEQNIDNPQKIRARADRIKTVVDQGSAVVQALLGFSRASDDSNESCEINAVVDNTVRLLGDRFLRETEVRFDRGAPLPSVRASTGLIQQILLNFIFNAAEAMTEHKEVIITTAQGSRLPPGLALSPARAAAYILVSVRDCGCGIAPEILPRIFEPFFTTKAFSARRGTGLGLSVAYELARKMGAGLAVESTPGQGSVFTLILPAAPVPASPPSPPAALSQRA